MNFMNQIKVIAFDLMGVILEEHDSDDWIYQQMDIYSGLDDIVFSQFFINQYHWSPEELLAKTKQYFNACYTIRDRSVFDLVSNYKFALASNHLTAVRDYLKKQDISKYFSEIIISSEIIFQKPDSKFYEVMLTSIKEKPENILFVDDNLENILAAQKFGLMTFNFNPKHDQYNLREQVEQELLKYQIS
jgi:HAD superfamily hydrolase (TIGR01509 family)